LALQQQMSEEERRSYLAIVGNQMAALQQPVVDHLTTMGQQVVYRAQYTPVVVVAASRSAIWDTVIRF
jgi:hypothetical protein